MDYVIKQQFLHPEGNVMLNRLSLLSINIMRKIYIFVKLQNAIKEMLTGKLLQQLIEMLYFEILHNFVKDFSCTFSREVCAVQNEAASVQNFNKQNNSDFVG